MRQLPPKVAAAPDHTDEAAPDVEEEREAVGLGPKLCARYLAAGDKDPLVWRFAPKRQMAEMTITDSCGGWIMGMGHVAAADDYTVRALYTFGMQKVPDRYARLADLPRAHVPWEELVLPFRDDLEAVAQYRRALLDLRSGRQKWRRPCRVA